MQLLTGYLQQRNMDAIAANTVADPPPALTDWLADLLPPGVHPPDGISTRSDIWATHHNTLVLLEVTVVGDTLDAQAEAAQRKRIE